MSKTGLRWGLSTDVGMVRKVNQDSVMANGTLFAVADGMGGHRGGEVASEIAAGHFRILERVQTLEELEEAVSSANEMIRARAAADPELTDLGHEQAAAMARWLTDERFDALYTSPMARARQTAAPLEKALGMTAMLADGVQEGHSSLRPMTARPENCRPSIPNAAA